MTEQTSLGRRLTVHPVAPAAMQRAVFIAVLSFLFFLGMMFAYYLRQDIGYFLLSTAFLIVYLAMMFAIFMQRKSAVEMFENGIHTRGRTIMFAQMSSLSDDGEIAVSGGKSLMISKSLIGHEGLLATLRSKIEQNSSSK